jgi:hypothetical protein
MWLTPKGRVKFGKRDDGSPEPQIPADLGLCLRQPIWENVGIMTPPLSLPDPVARSLIARSVDHDRPAATYAKACLEAKAIFATSFETLAESNAARHARRGTAPARRS